MKLTLEEVKEFCRIDHEAEDAFLSSLILASEAQVIGATHQNADKESDVFKLCQKFLILHWYENREIAGKADTMPFHLESLLLLIMVTSEGSL